MRRPRFRRVTEAAADAAATVDATTAVLEATTAVAAPAGPGPAASARPGAAAIVEPGPAARVEPGPLDIFESVDDGAGAGLGGSLSPGETLGEDDGGAPLAPVIELRGLARTFPGDPPVHALHDVELVVPRGDYVSVVGPSGAGKSTLLHILGLLDRPTSGDYLLDGLPTRDLSEQDRSALRGGRIGFVFQSFHLLPHRSVLDNVMLATLYSGVPRTERRERALAALERVGMGHRLDFMPPVLSGGERQRVAVARAVIASPHVLLADEPTGNLDSATSAGVLDLFDELHADGLTLLVITHDADVSARARRRVRISDGTLSEVG